MQSRCFASFVACAALVDMALAANVAKAQAPRSTGSSAARPALPVTPMPVAPPPLRTYVTPAAPVPVFPATVSTTYIETRPTQPIPGSGLFRGRAMIGMSVWGSDQERLGTISDFMIDYAGGIPDIYVALLPSGAGWTGDYVIVPFDAFRVGYNDPQRADYLVLDVTSDSLWLAPRLAVDRWNLLPDRQFFADARQFYRRTERTAARIDADAYRSSPPPGTVVVPPISTAPPVSTVTVPVNAGAVPVETRMVPADTTVAPRSLPRTAPPRDIGWPMDSTRWQTYDRPMYAPPGRSTNLGMGPISGAGHRPPASPPAPEPTGKPPQPGSNSYQPDVRVPSW